MDIKVDTSPILMNVSQTESEKKLLRYSDHEKQILYALFKEYGDIIDRHKRRFSKHKSKRSELQEAWQEILTRFNISRNTTQRNLKQIQKFWLNTRLRKSIMEEGRNNVSQFPGYDGGCSSGDQKVRIFGKQMKNEKVITNVAADESRDYRDREEKWHIINQHQQNNQSNDYEEADDEDEDSNEARDDNNSENIMIRTNQHMKQEVTADHYNEDQEENEEEEEDIEEHRNGSIDVQYDERTSSQNTNLQRNHSIQSNRNGAYTYSTNVPTTPKPSVTTSRQQSTEPTTIQEGRSLYEGYATTSPPSVIHTSTAIPTIQISNLPSNTPQPTTSLDNYQFNDSQSNILRIQEQELRIKEMHLRYEQQRIDLLKSQEELDHQKEINRLRLRELNLKILILEQQLKSRADGVKPSKKSKS